ncbi:MAG: LysE family translocator [Hyphomicrobiaceae bacterium]
MSMGILAAFVAACIFLALTPGPNMSLIIANTTAHGLKAGLWTLAGSTTGLAILVAVAALGMTSVMILMADWFDVIRWLGAAYLVYLGARQLHAVLRSPSAGRARPPRGGSLYLNGLLVSLSNPKVLLFLGAFLPQFVDPARAPGPQLALLAAVFVATLAAVDVTYTLVLARARRAFTARHTRVLDGVAGGLLLAGGALLATLRRPT